MKPGLRLKRRLARLLRRRARIVRLPTRARLWPGFVALRLRRALVLWSFLRPIGMSDLIRPLLDGPMIVIGIEWRAWPFLLGRWLPPILARTRRLLKPWPFLRRLPPFIARAPR